MEKNDFEVLPVGTVAFLARLGYILEHGRWVPADGGCVEWVEPDEVGLSPKKEILGG